MHRVTSRLHTSIIDVIFRLAILALAPALVLALAILVLALVLVLVLALALTPTLVLALTLVPFQPWHSVATLTLPAQDATPLAFIGIQFPVIPLLVAGTGF